MQIKIADLRQDYLMQSLDANDVDKNPISQFKKWFEEAVNAQILEPNAMTLATVSAQGKPSARVVLLKDVDTEGFTFYTNYESKKGRDMADNPQVALCFNWLDLQRQVRIEGTVEKVPTATSEAYFRSRPKGSQIGAWASPQSREVSDRAFLENNYEKLSSDFADTEGEIPLPSFWGGYNVKPTLIEFWQGRSSRLHDRICYEKQSDASWKITRLAP